ncbi:hypothetical protein KP509_05G054200 [Ceratopteris richardii]|uniref:tRNA 4-demethylwyosine synthase (AdoMet-dependent) n=1 Tax=Ceratopteris richardii TaxID=49495 RepID=A0A8T2UR27_CERRI|nr:hypothetical protein KP509_05G054200 [Ceratopteris richardii]
MERNRVQLAVQSVSLGLLSLALWHFYRTRRRNLREAAIRREWELIWQQDAEGLQEAGLDEYGMRLSDEIEDEITSTQASRPCAKGTKGCGTCNVNYSSLPQGPTRQVCSGNGMTKSIKDVTQTPEHAKIGKVIYASQTGRAKSLAQQLVQHLSSQGIQIELVDPSYYEPEDLAKEKLVLLIAATWSDGSVPLHASFFGRWLEESAADFRVGAQLLDGCKFAVFGIGSKLYGSDYNLVAKSWDHYMEKLGASRILDRGEGDEDEGYVEHRFDVWKDQLVGRIKDSSQSFKQGGIVKKDDDYEDAYDEFFTDEDSEKEDKENLGEALIDVEDVAGKVNPSHNVSKVHIRGGKGQVFKRRSSNEEAINHKQESQIKEMVTPAIRMNLEKQGYKIIGTHSGVKLCRWTKSQLRGRGGCYKHSFYGIESHRCMETTPSLACANKCVFCWRHHTNPVGKSWKWKMDDPIEIVETALDLHTNMIKQMKGVPGVKHERLMEGLNPRHCALSLVGEPIMYPRINTLIAELHKRKISTFLVTNAQFPECIENLSPVTQLYVSVDASTKERLKAIDRPLFADFWERFIESLRALRNKHQRTVYRLTLVKGWNTAELEEYAELINIGQPDFIEIKGVTYCGTSNTSNLTMENVPWHEDVKAFAEELSKKSDGKYGLACEHAHSCCVLLANTTKFWVEGKWYTWIDYDKFHKLVTAGGAFSSEDYMAVTPVWAVYGSAEGGFDPTEVRFKKERRHAGKPVSGGCT